MIPKIFAKRHGLLALLLAGGLLTTFGWSLKAPTFISHESGMLSLPLLSWWKNVPLIFSRDFLMFTEGQFRPLSYALLAVVRTFIGTDHVLFWHGWLLAFHGLNAILVFVLVRRFSKRLWSAGLAGLFFAFHPVSSVVANDINSFHFMLGLSFYLGSLCCYLAFAETSRRKLFVAAVGLFALGLFTSKLVLTLPIVLAAYEGLIRRSGWRAVLMRLWPYAAILLIFSPLWLFYQPHPLHYKYIDFPNGAGWNSFFSVVGATGWYARGLLLGWGIPVVLHEAAEHIFGVAHWRFLFWGAIDLALLVAAGWAMRRKHWAGLGVVLLFSAMLPFASTAWNGVAHYVSWAYLYVPLVGLAFLVGGVADWLFNLPWRRVRVAGLAILCLIVLYYGVGQTRLNRASRSEVDYWRRVLRLHPGSETASVKLGKAYLNRGEEPRALDYLFSPGVTQLHESCLAMSGYYAARGDLLASAIHLRVAGQRKDGLQSQDYEMGAAALFDAAGAPDYAEAASGETLITNPFHIAAMERLAEILMFKGYVAAAGRLTGRASELAPSHPVSVRMRRKLEAKRSRLAPSGTPQILRPPDPNWLQYVVRGLCDRKFGEEIVRVSERLRSDPVLQMQAGVCLVREGHPKLGLAKLRFAVQSLSASSYAWAMTCWAASEAGAYPEAREAGLRAQELDPQNATVHYVLGHLAGALARGSGNVTQAIRHYQQALELDPRNASTYNSLGTCFLRQGKSEEAISHFREALRIRPDYAQAQNNLGLAFARKDKLDEAISHFREALRIRPDYAQAQNNLGVVLVKQEKFDEAIAHFREALRIDPEHVNARNNLQVLMKQHQ